MHKHIHGLTYFSGKCTKTTGAHARIMSNLGDARWIRRQLLMGVAKGIVKPIWSGAICIPHNLYRYGLDDNMDYASTHRSREGEKKKHPRTDGVGLTRRICL